MKTQRQSRKRTAKEAGILNLTANKDTIQTEPKKLIEDQRPSVSSSIENTENIDIMFENKPVCKHLNLLSLEWSTIPLDWLTEFADEFQKEYFLKLKKQLLSLKTTVYPCQDDIYSFTKCPLDSIKVVIIGQGKPK